jgi:hypothetical protein
LVLKGHVAFDWMVGYQHSVAFVLRASPPTVTSALAYDLMTWMLARNLRGGRSSVLLYSL